MFQAVSFASRPASVCMRFEASVELFLQTQSNAGLRLISISHSGKVVGRRKHLHCESCIKVSRRFLD